MRRPLLVVCVSLLALGTLGGCATIIHGSTQPITITSDPDGATVKVNGTNLTTPATVHLQRKRNYVVTIKKAGYETQTVELRKSLDGWFWGNLIIGGIPGWIIDGITGSASKLSPDIVSVTLQKVDIGDARKEEETMLQKEQSP